MSRPIISRPMSQTPVPLPPWCKHLSILPIGWLNVCGARECVRRLGRLIWSCEIQGLRAPENWIGVKHSLIDIADRLRGSWRPTTAPTTGLFAQRLCEVAPLASDISIKTQEEWIGNAQGVTFFLEIKEPASNGHCLLGPRP